MITEPAKINFASYSSDQAFPLEFKGCRNNGVGKTRYRNCRLIMHWFSKNHIAGNPISFQSHANWYSEGLLSSQFLAVYRGDDLAESYTHADGIIGNIAIGEKGKGDVCLIEPFNQFIVLEAKMFSKLSSGTTRVPEFNQVARNVACMANLISNSNCNVDEIEFLGFYVLAPEDQLIEEATFIKYMNKETIHNKVLSRVELYKKRPEDYRKKREWFDRYFEPVLSHIDIRLIPWEDVINEINEHDLKTGKELSKFYSKCVDFNRRA